MVLRSALRTGTALGGPLGEGCFGTVGSHGWRTSSAHGWLERVPNKPTACGLCRTSVAGEWITVNNEVMPRLILYHREGCYLCTQMHEALLALQNQYTFLLETVDIDADPELQARFNVKVPVLALDDTILCCHVLDRAALLDELTSE